MYNYQNKILPHPIIRNPNYSIALPAAIVGGFMLITFFLLMNMLGYEAATELRFLNFIILIPVIIYSLKTYVDTVPQKSYFEALRVSFLSFFGAYTIMAVFMFFYLMVFDRGFMVYLSEYAIPGIKLNAFGVTALLLGEGCIGAVILSYVILQFYKAKIKWMA